ncbi:hypothetical protein [Sediminitomix flava]|uniref:LPP20 lipoprotein n=1 Tax=Sediminitomix flava TaxID=379075 RepID=A0A315ZAF0_SEDFL|nr:hypothetical protein [Sediminitomix flava]PWJ42566.1 hypothetical protein BC781_102109 [Sediminitomix flava]
MKRFIACFFLLSLYFTSFAQRPNWSYHHQREKLFPKAKFLIGFYQVPMETFEQEKMQSLEQLAKTALIENVRVNVQSVSTLKERSFNDELDTYFGSDSRVNAELELSGLQIESYFNKFDKEAYALAYVERKKLIDFYSGLLNRGLKKGSTNNNEIRMNLVDGEVGTALKWYSENVAIYIKNKEYTSILNGLGVFGELLPTSEFDVFEQELFSLHSFFSKRLKLTSIPKTNTQNHLGAQLNYEGEKVEGVKIKFQNLLDSTRSFLTNNEGNAVIPKKHVPVQNIFQLHAEIDIWAELPEKLQNRYHSKAKSLSFQSLHKEIRVIEAQVYIKSIEYSLGEKQSQSLIEAHLKDLLALKGYVFTDSPQSADYVITINAESEKGRSMYGRYVSYADVSVSVEDSENGLELYQNKYPEIRGVGRSYQNAGRLALENVLPDLSKDILKTIKGE